MLPTDNFTDMRAVSRERLKNAVVSLIRRGRTPWSFTVYRVQWPADPVPRPERNGNPEPEIRSPGCDGGSENSAVWKDLGDRPWIFRLIFRASLRQEVDALRALETLPAAPRLYALADRDGFVMESLDALRLPHLRDNDLDAVFFAQLREAMLSMHALGVAHGDFRRTNILIETASRAPRIIDFGTAVALGPNPSFLRRCHWRAASRIDRLQYSKLKDYYLPGSLTEEEGAWLRQAPWWYNVGAGLRRRVYRPLKWRNLRKTLWKWGLPAKRRRRR